MEESLGIQLFQRTSSAVLLTSIGEKFIHGARMTLASMNDLIEVVERDRKALGGLIKLGTSPSFGPYFLPTFLPPIHEDYPDLQIYIIEDRPASIENAVLEGTLDCAIGPACEQPALHFVPLGEERLFLGVPAAHRLAREASVKPSKLKGERLLALGSGNRLFEIVRHLAQATGAVVVDDYEGTSLDAIRQMVSIGMGLSLFPELYARAEFRDGDDVRLIEVEGWKETRSVGLYYRDNSGRKHHFEELAVRARQAAQKLAIGAER